ncbi:MAG: Hsp20/alpha crystallin family protein [Actinomycetota bacterium]|nr:Hsp20/alpha crystallin family protein [Actinomycetota bacterium]
MLWTDPFVPLLAQYTRNAAFIPAGDLAVSENDLVLTLDLPGLTPEDLSIEVQDGELTVRGERRRPQGEEGTSYAYAQRPFGAFEHRVQIPQGVDTDAITASMENGVLSLIVPKPEPLKPRKIEIETNKEERQLAAAGV